MLSNVATVAGLKSIHIDLQLLVFSTFSLELADLTAKLCDQLVFLGQKVS